MEIIYTTVTCNLSAKEVFCLPFSLQCIFMSSYLFYQVAGLVVIGVICLLVVCVMLMTVSSMSICITYYVVYLP